LCEIAVFEKVHYSCLTAFLQDILAGPRKAESFWISIHAARDGISWTTCKPFATRSNR